MRPPFRVAAAAALLLAAPAAMADDYAAPDGLVDAQILVAGPSDCESMVEIHRGAEKLGSADYRSDDHEHGECVDQASWTADSKFFVFSLENAGGHQSWNAHVIVFSCETGRFLELERSLKDPITSSAFTLSAPDIVEVEITELPLDDSHKPHRQIIKLGTLSAQ